MFRKFSVKENVSGTTAVKSSVQRQLRSKLAEQYPHLNDPVEGELLEKYKESMESNAASTGGKKKGAKRGGNAAPAQADEDGEGESEENKVTLLDFIWPKKENITLYKCKDHISLYVLHDEPIFFQRFDDEIYLTLRIIHKFPQVVNRVQVDQGAIRFVLGGANVMAPGLTSPTAKLPDTNLPKDEIVTVYAYGKDNAMSIGKLMESTDDIAKTKKGPAIETVHYLGDDLWKTKF